MISITLDGIIIDVQEPNSSPFFIDEENDITVLLNDSIPFI
jgi:hypothetical protein